MRVSHTIQDAQKILGLKVWEKLDFHRAEFEVQVGEALIKVWNAVPVRKVTLAHVQNLLVVGLVPGEAQVQVFEGVLVATQEREEGVQEGILFRRVVCGMEF